MIVPMMHSAIFSVNNPKWWVLSIIECVLEELVESTFDVCKLILSSSASVLKFFESDLHLISDVFSFIVPWWANAQDPSGSSSSEFSSLTASNVVIILRSSHSSDVWHELRPGLFRLSQERPEPHCFLDEIIVLSVLSPLIVWEITFGLEFWFQTISSHFPQDSRVLWDFRIISMSPSGDFWDENHQSRQNY